MYPHQSLSPLHPYISPLETVDPVSPDADLGPFASMVHNARIIAIGEATHGTSEFHLMNASGEIAATQR
jgi:erythromycin esterase-like protein